MAADVVVVAGYFARCPLGGYGWQILHYLAGLRAAGVEPYFYEDTATYAQCVDPTSGLLGTDPRNGIAAAAALLVRFGFGDRWIFWDAAGDQYHGRTRDEARAILDAAHAVITLAAVTRVPRRRGQTRVFIDLDPGFTQIRAAQGDRGLVEILGDHDVHFTLGENIGSAECPVPTAGIAWRPTRQPVAVELWDPLPADADAPFTTIGRWDEPHRDLLLDGVVYPWRKRVEWLRFTDLPRRTGARFLLAMDVDAVPADQTLLERYGWAVADPVAVSSDPFGYRDFIRRSRGEFTVAKTLNVRLQTGWFSDRSACYLAAGRPVVTQDTGFGRVLPTGAGLFAVANVDAAAAAIGTIAADFATQSAAARHVAVTEFDAGAVMRRLLQRA